MLRRWCRHRRCAHRPQHGLGARGWAASGVDVGVSRSSAVAARHGPAARASRKKQPRNRIGTTPINRRRQPQYNVPTRRFDFSLRARKKYQLKRMLVICFGLLAGQVFLPARIPEAPRPRLDSRRGRCRRNHRPQAMFRLQRSESLRSVIDARSLTHDPESRDLAGRGRPGRSQSHGHDRKRPSARYLRRGWRLN